MKPLHLRIHIRNILWIINMLLMRISLMSHLILVEVINWMRRSQYLFILWNVIHFQIHLIVEWIESVLLLIMCIESLVSYILKIIWTSHLHGILVRNQLLLLGASVLIVFFKWINVALVHSNRWLDEISILSPDFIVISPLFLLIRHNLLRILLLFISFSLLFFSFELLRIILWRILVLFILDIAVLVDYEFSRVELNLIIFQKIIGYNFFIDFIWLRLIEIHLKQLRNRSFRTILIFW